MRRSHLKGPCLSGCFTLFSALFICFIFTSGRISHASTKTCSDDIHLKLIQLLERQQKNGPAQTLPSIGIEFEGTTLAHIKRSDLYKSLVKTVQSHIPNLSHTLSPQEAAQFNPKTGTTAYHLEYQHKGHLYHWSLIDDPTLRERSGTPFELVSPILRDADDVKLYLKVFENLKKVGILPLVNTGGVHVHVDFPNDQFAAAAALKLLFSKVERQAQKKLKTTSARQYAVGPPGPTELSLLKEALEHPELNNYLELLPEISSRMQSLNLHALKKHKTVEFRLFNSTIHPELIALYAEFAQNLVHAVRSGSPQLIKLLKSKQTRLEELALEDLAEAVGAKLFKNKEAMKLLEVEVRKASLFYKLLSTEPTLQNINEMKTIGTLIVLSAAALAAISYFENSSIQQKELVKPVH